MARHDVNIVVRARDEASRQFGKIGGSAMTMGSMLKKAAAMAGAYLGARQLLRFGRDSLAEFGKQEQAVNGLAAAYRLLGIEGTAPVKAMEKFADEMQKTTRYGDEAVLELATMGATMAKLSGKELEVAVKAAMGLAKAYKIDVVGAMRLIAKAKAGDTQTLARYNIKLKEGLSAQQKYNEVVRMGGENFKLVTAESKDYVVAIEMMKNHISNLKEKIGEALAPTVLALADRIKMLNMEHVRSAFNFGKWAIAIGSAVYLAPKIVGAILSIAKALKALATMQAVSQALSGPAGWAALAVGTVIAALAVKGLERAFSGLNDTMGDTVELNKEVLKTQIAAKEKKIAALQKEILLGEENPPFRTGMGMEYRTYSSKGKENKLKDLTLEASELKRQLAEVEKAAQGAGRAFAVDPNWKENWLKSMVGDVEAAAGNPAWEKVRDRIVALRQSIADFGKSENQLLIEDMLKVGYSDQSIGMVAADQGRKSYLEQTMKITGALSEAAKDLKHQIATFGKTALESMIYDLKELGATASQLAPIMGLVERVKGLQDKAAVAASTTSMQRQQLSFQETRFLTFSAGTKFDYEQQTAKNTHEQLAIQRQVLTVQRDTLLEIRKNQVNKGQQFGLTNFTS
jgi:hypothetical protein